MKNSIAILLLIFISLPSFAQKSTTDKNIKMYHKVWDDVINKGMIDEINAKNFDANITMITSPENVVGIDAFKAYYQNFLTGFSDVEFTIIDAFGMDDKIVKHWNFKGKHTGVFFGIPPTQKSVDMEGVTLVKMKNGKIAQEQDFMDNSALFQQLGLTSDPNNVSVVDGLYKAFSVGDIPAVLGTMDAEIVWNEAEGNALADGNPYIGPDAVLKGVFAKIPTDFIDFHLSDVVLHEMSDNKVLATVRYNATSNHNGKKLDAQAAHLWTLKDGKIVAFQQYVDTKQLDEMMTK